MYTNSGECGECYDFFSLEKPGVFRHCQSVDRTAVPGRCGVTGVRFYNASDTLSGEIKINTYSRSNRGGERP
jgi:hypothetical protein